MESACRDGTMRNDASRRLQTEQDTAKTILAQILLIVDRAFEPVAILL
jgi:hypothetical protein